MTGEAAAEISDSAIEENSPDLVFDRTSDIPLNSYRKEIKMQNLTKFLKELIFCPTVSGYEKTSAQKILDLCLEYTDGFFNEAYITKTSSIVLCRKCAGKNASRLVFDAHLDTIGFAVSEICGDGYLRLAPLGGIDANILPSSEILLLGKEQIRGIVSSIPPHLSGSDKLPDIGELFVDTGYSHETLKTIVDVGTPAMLYPHLTQLLSSRISATSLDDKLCIASCMEAVKKLGKNTLSNTDIYVYLSSGEERGGNGSHHIYEEIRPDALIVLDVNFAKEKGSADGEFGLLGGGAMLSYSAVTSVKFTKFIHETANKANLQIQPVNEMTWTGTNADVAAKAGLGTASAVLSIPIKYMHSSVETADMKDVITCAEILKETAIRYDASPVCKPVYFKRGGTNGEL